MSYSFENIFLYGIALFTGSFLASVYLVPKVKRIVSAKQLMDEPNQRSSHKKSTPSLGGIAFYMIFIFGLYFNNQYDQFDVAMSILPGITLMFFLGLKDDLVALSPRIKLGGQVLACLFVLYHYKFEIESFHGFFGIFDMPIWVTVPFAMLIMLAIINAYNLVDGIDGLAASISTVALLFYALCFFWIGRYFLAFTAIVMIGALIGFLVFNLSERRKIFMGDTGSLVIGFLIAVFSIRLLALDNGLQALPFNPKYVPVIMGTIIFVPLFDVIRVFTLRIVSGKNPMSPDRKHIHHVVIDKLGWSHRRTAFAISCVSFFITSSTILLIMLGFGLIVIMTYLSLVVIFITGLLYKWLKEIETEI